MKKSILFVAIAAFCSLQLSAQIKINPKVGITLNRLDTDPADFKSSARPGFTLGGDVRLGSGRFYFLPGAHYNVMSYNLVDLTNDKPEFNKDVTSIKSIKVPLNVGFNIIDLKLFRVRAFGGATGYQVTGVSDNSIGLTKADFAKRYWGANAGLGLDLAFLTVDLSYEWGQSAIFNNQPDTKYKTLALTAGLKF